MLILAVFHYFSQCWAEGYCPRPFMSKVCPQIHHSIGLSFHSWWLSFASGAMVGVWIALCLSTVTEVHVWDFVEESWIQ